MVHRYRLWVVPAVIAAITPVACGDILNITNDTYIDSYNFVTDALLNNTNINFGHSGAVKAVVSSGSTQYPFANSVVHGLFTLPDAFWTAAGSSPVSSAVITFRVRNNGSIGSRHIELHP